MDGRALNARKENYWTPKQLRMLRELMDTGLIAKEIAERVNEFGPYKTRRAVNAKIHSIRSAGSMPPPIRLAGPRWSWPARIRDAVDAKQACDRPSTIDVKGSEA